MMRKTDEEKNRSKVIKARLTPAEARTVKELAQRYRMSLSDYLRTASLKQKMKMPPEETLHFNAQLGAIERQLTALLAQSLERPDSLLVWKNLCILNEQIERLVREVRHSC